MLFASTATSRATSAVPHPWPGTMLGLKQAALQGPPEARDGHSTDRRRCQPRPCNQTSSAERKGTTPASHTCLLQFCRPWGAAAWCPETNWAVLKGSFSSGWECFVQTT